MLQPGLELAGTAVKVDPNVEGFCAVMLGGPAGTYPTKRYRYNAELQSTNGFRAASKFR